MVRRELMSPAHPERHVYSDRQAAAALGITVEELHTLIQTHVLQGDAGPDLATVRFNEADLLALRLLAQQVVLPTDGN